MVKRNPNFAKLNAGYLFPEINKRKQALLKKNPDAKLISLGIGDTTQAIPCSITEKLSEYVKGLSTSKGYSGYGSEQGMTKLREKIAETLYEDLVLADEVFVSDGSKCDIGRLQVLFGNKVTIAVQDPTYPAYVDTGVIVGQTGLFNHENCNYENIIYMPCLPENNFFPDLVKMPRADLIYFCSPNNPTGATASKEQLEQLVKYAKENKSIIIFDSAYSAFIRDPSYPRSIYEIEGAREVAIEVGSFSKMAGFTGIRLGWSIVPHQLKFDDESSVRKDWERICTTFFNGASNIAQEAGFNVLDFGMKEVKEVSDYYMNNAKIIKFFWKDQGFPVYGGEHAPYIWVQFPERKSWDVFEELLEEAYVISTPGSGFGAAGEGFIRFSAFGHLEEIETALIRLNNYFAKNNNLALYK